MCVKITISPCQPQGNRVVKYDASLKLMLVKAKSNGVDWSKFLPLALFFIRQVPNRDTGVSRLN